MKCTVIFVVFCIFTQIRGVPVTSMQQPAGFIYGQIQGEGSGKVDITFSLAGANVGANNTAGVGDGMGSSSMQIQPASIPYK